MFTTQEANTNNWIKINGLRQQKIQLISIEQPPQPIINVNTSPGLGIEKIKTQIEQEDSRIQHCRRRNTELIAKIERCTQETVQRQKIEYNHYKKEVEYENEKIKESHVRVEKNKMLKEEYEKYKTSIEESHDKIKKQIEEEVVRLEKIQIQKEQLFQPINLKIFEEDWAILENIKTHSSQENKMLELEKIKMQEEEERKQLEKTQGFVYCFSNTHVEDLYKIGLTQKLTPDGRAKQLRGTGQIGKWQVEFAKKVRDCRKTEKVLHATFKKYHVDKEMFKVKDIDEIRKEFDLLQGEWYNPHNTQKITSHFNNL